MVLTLMVYEDRLISDCFCIQNKRTINISTSYIKCIKKLIWPAFLIILLQQNRNIYQIISKNYPQVLFLHLVLIEIITSLVI